MKINMIFSWKLFIFTENNQLEMNSYLFMFILIQNSKFIFKLN